MVNDFHEVLLSMAHATNMHTVLLLGRLCISDGAMH